MIYAYMHTWTMFKILHLWHLPHDSLLNTDMKISLEHMSTEFSSNGMEQSIGTNICTVFVTLHSNIHYVSQKCVGLNFIKESLLSQYSSRNHVVTITIQASWKVLMSKSLVVFLSFLFWKVTIIIYLKKSSSFAMSSTI